MKDLVLATALLFLISCNNQNKPANKAGIEPLIVPVDTVATDPVKITTLQISALNYSSWPAFWHAFTTATQKKDTPAMVGLINFPFSQNAEVVTEIECNDLLLPQLEGMEKATEPIDAYGFPLQGRNKMPPIDSVRYTNFDQRDYFFGKVNGYYKLVEIITPG